MPNNNEFVNLEGFEDKVKKAQEAKKVKIIHPSEIDLYGTNIKAFEDSGSWIVTFKEGTTDAIKYTLYTTIGISGLLFLIFFIKLFTDGATYIVRNLALLIIFASGIIFPYFRLKKRWQIKFSYDEVEIIKHQIGMSIIKWDFDMIKRIEKLMADMPDIFGVPVAIISTEDRVIFTALKQEADKLHQLLLSIWHYYKKQREDAGEIQVEPS